jgi:hypothetical protein
VSLRQACCGAGALNVDRCDARDTPHLPTAVGLRFAHCRCAIARHTSVDDWADCLENWFSCLKRLSHAALAAVLLLGMACAALAQSAALSQKAADAAEMTAITQQQGSVRVIIMFDSPVPASQVRPDATSIANIKAQVAATQDAIIATHFGSATSPAAGQGFERALTRFPITPGFALNVSQQELEALAADARVVRINQDRVRPPSLTDSVPLIGTTAISSVPCSPIRLAAQPPRSQR